MRQCQPLVLIGRGSSRQLRMSAPVVALRQQIVEEADQVQPLARHLQPTAEEAMVMGRQNHPPAGLAMPLSAAMNGSLLPRLGNHPPRR